eukprot:3085517-Alexandrium_andersonii.AAC.1
MRSAMSGSAVQKSSQSSASGRKAHGGRERPSAWKPSNFLPRRKAADTSSVAKLCPFAAAKSAMCLWESLSAVEL